MSQSAVPTVSVVIPMLDAEATIAEQLAGLTEQTYPGVWEVIVADNGSADASAAIVRDWKDRIALLRLVDASAKSGSPFARNIGVKSARGEIILMCDADDVVSPDWIAAMTEGLDRYDAVRGVLDWDSLNDPIVNEWYRPVNWWWKPAAPVRGVALPGGNFGMRKTDYLALGGYSEDLPWGDKDFSFRAEQAGLNIGEVPQAVVRGRHRSDLRSLWSQSFGRGRHNVAVAYSSQRPRLPLVNWLRLSISYPTWLILHLPGAVFSRARRGRWILIAGQCAGWLYHRFRRTE